VSHPPKIGLDVLMWMNQPSPHQEQLSSELTAHGVDLKVVYASGLRKERKEIGWQVDADPIWAVFLPGRYSLRHALRRLLRNRQAVHVINGIWAEPTFFAVLMVCCLLKIPCCIYSEAPASMGLSTLGSCCKRFIQRSIVRLIAARVMGLLAISWLAERAFVSLGFPESKIYRFGYFEKMPEENLPEISSGCNEILYVGRLVRRKGIELLIEAATPLLHSNQNLGLRIVGGGPIEPELRRKVRENAIEKQTVFAGVVSSSSIPGLLQGVLMLVLPSEADGWGIVVNQALQAGIPVVVSDASGAAELTKNGVNGFVFRAGDRVALQQCIRAIVDDPQPQRMRTRAREAGRAASAECAAPYLLRCLEHMLGLRADRPVPKWILNHEPKPDQFLPHDSVGKPDVVLEPNAKVGAPLRVAKLGG
jgi:glycosyltransferase involved in cell wall biosynthesis